ncbi:MAG: hypothetical protein MJY61_02990 [Bacteroidales bacterium]|nr:hypothetical protein [Bacteroidales bacterium]
MLGRRILRIKAFKTVYSFAENPDMTLKEATRQLDQSCEATRDLYLLMLSLPCAVTAEAAERIEAAKSKFHPTPEELAPNMKFAENGIAAILRQDPDFNKILQKKKFSWDQCDVLLRHLYDNLREKDYFKEYMSDSKRSLKEDAALWTRFFEEEIEDNREIEPILEDMNIWWNDDLAYALIWDCKTIAQLAKGRGWTMPELYQSEMRKDPGAEDDRKFVHKLVEKAVTGYDRYCETISGCTPKWDRSRICTTDLVLIACGLAESEAFPGTARSVIINEYVEISKFYSTGESRAFVNGILDKLTSQKI